VLESIAYRIREIADFTAARPEGCVPPESLPVDGGLARSDVFLQIQADILGRPVERHQQVEATALGAAMAGAMGVGTATAADLESCTRYERVFEPMVDPAEAAEGLRRWQDTALGIHTE
jgi:glycerol kinase